MYRREKYRERRRKKYKASRPKKQKKRGKHHEYLQLISFWKRLFTYHVVLQVKAQITSMLVTLGNLLCFWKKHWMYYQRVSLGFCLKLWWSREFLLPRMGEGALEVSHEWQGWQWAILGQSFADLGFNNFGFGSDSFLHPCPRHCFGPGTLNLLGLIWGFDFHPWMPNRGLKQIKYEQNSCILLINYLC